MTRSKKKAAKAPSTASSVADGVPLFTPPRSDDASSTVSSYWSDHDFTPDPSESLSSAFNRLSIIEGWKGQQRARERARALGSEYLFHFHADNWTSEGKLATWQRLCAMVGKKEESSVTKCKKSLSTMHINLFDLMEAFRTGKPVKTFENYAQLQNNTRKKNRCFPKEVAKEDGFIKVFLKRIF